MQIKQQQSRDSVRLTWNVMASNRTLQARSSIPQAIHYTPLHIREQLIDHTPPTCTSCHAHMNPYNRISINKAEFTCCICKTANKLPTNYFVTHSQIPPEMTLNYSSFIMTQSDQLGHSAIGFLFVVDTCILQKQLDAVKQSILQLVANLDDSYNVGLICFNKYVTIYDMASSSVKMHSFSPHEQHETIDFMKMLEMQMGEKSKRTSRFINPLSECRRAFEKSVRSLAKIKHHSYKHQRQARATGQALNLAISINQLTATPSKIVFFCGGPCTVGAGKVIEQDFKNEMRSIRDETPKLSKSAKEYYLNLAAKTKSKHICIDSFIFSVEESGLNEMSELLTSTGGLLVQHEEFDSTIFRQSFRKAYIGLADFPPLQTAVFSSIAVKCSSQILISENFIDKREKKQNEFVLACGGLSETRTFTFLLELSELNTDSEAFYIQIKTIYRYPQNLGIKFERVTTIRRLFGAFESDLASGFDQGAALALLAQLAIVKSLEMSGSEVRQWLDNLLCKWAATFGEYRTGEALSFRLAENIRAFPQFVYNIRRHALVRRTGVSLDELTYINAIIMSQSVENIMLIVQPALLQYTPHHNEMLPIPLDEKFMRAENILVLDSFFNVVEWRGSLVEWEIAQGYQQMPEHASLAALLRNVEQDVHAIKNDRFPVPHYYLTGPNHSKERFIKSRLNSRDHDQSESNLTDEVDVNAFTEKLIELVVNRKL